MEKGKQNKLPLNIQFFAENGGQDPAVATGTNATTQNTAQGTAIDYDKIQAMIDSRNQRNEESILKSYFQKEGLNEDELKEAISTFKTKRDESKKQQVVDNQNLQNQLNDANARTLKAEIEKEAFIQALGLGVDVKTMPYLTKLADFSSVTDDKGGISGDKVKEALNKVLTDVPSLKANDNTSMPGIQVGPESTPNNGGSLDNVLSSVFGIKK